ncbi:LysR substrate-binding domain-containing protein [Streptomyces sp.]|uniref:LysR substrate-binding domain-containing protein n=1 Tax=Streptomyces sp. TaxID=1931 RepID=UPI0025D85027|nr:LysR substrate-binding domain-containing protein [Streptomyces sp.]
MNEIEQGEERITTLVDPERGVVSLGFLHSFGGWLVPELLNLYRDIAPSTSFALSGGAADVVVDDVRKGRADIGFVAPRPVADDVQWVPLGREVPCLGVPPGHVFEGRGQIAVADLADEPMVALKAGYGLRHVTDRLFREAGLTPRIKIEVTELSTLRALVSAGMGVALVPAPQPGHVSTTRNIPLSDEGAFRSYGAVARQYGPSGRAARRFLSFVASRAVPEPPADSEERAD